MSEQVILAMVRRGLLRVIYDPDRGTSRRTLMPDDPDEFFAGMGFMLRGESVRPAGR